MKSLSISSLLLTIALFGISCGGDAGRVEGPIQYSDAATAFAEGEKLFDANKFEMAVNAYRQAVALDNLNGDAYFKLGISLSLIESKARELMKEVVTADGGDKSILPVSESQKAFEGAVAAYKTLLEKSPGDASVQFCRFKKYGIRYIDYKDVEFLKKFLNEQGKLLPRRLTGNSLKFQRKVSDAVKKARQMALLPYVTDLLK